MNNASPGDADAILQLLDRMNAFWNQSSPDAPSLDGSAALAAADIFAADFSGYDVTDHTIMTGPEGAERTRQRLHHSFPDIVFERLETIREGNRISVYWTARGTHRGVMLNIPPTGRSVEVNGVTLLYLERGKIKRSVHLWDLAGLLRALGLLPELDSRPPLDTFQLKDALTVC